jgi:hypothetical protein
LYYDELRHAHLRRPEQVEQAEDGTCRQPVEVVEVRGVRIAIP